MNFKHLSLALALGAFLPLASASAAKVQNVKVEADYDNLNLMWDKLSDSDFGDADGYAIQWSDRESDVRITEPVTIYQENNQDDKALRRNTFENNNYYFARVYTYKIDRLNNKVLGNGSDLYKFRLDFNNSVESENIAITDPVISNESGTEQDTSDFEFGMLRKYPYDTFSDFFWSQPREMTSSDFDGFMIRVSENNDLSDPIVEATVANDVNRLRITGLDADTSYYAQGYFYKDQGGSKVTFGDSPVRSFETILAIPRDSSTRASRNILKVENRAIRKVAVDGNASSSTTTSSSASSASNTASESTSTASNTASLNTNVSSSSQTTIDQANQAEVRQKIADLKRQISSLQSDLRRWEARLDSDASTQTSAPSTPPRSSMSGLSIRERLKLILEAKRNQ